MKILPVMLNKVQKQSFGSGVTSFYTDFDGTFFPFHQDLLKQKDDNPELSIMNKMYSAFKNFSAKAKNKFNILITTGRGRKEMEYVLERIKYAGIVFCKPEECILRDGLDEFQLEDTGNEYILNHLPNKKPKSTETLRKMAESVIKSVDTDNSLVIIHAGINKNMSDYGRQSLEHIFNLQPIDKRKRYASITVEDNGLIEIVFPPNVDTHNYEEGFREFFKKNELGYSIISSKSDHNFYIPYQEDSVEEYKFVPGNCVILKPLTNNKMPDKIDQPKEKVKRIIEEKSNDLIIVAGDGINDTTMLNPLEYLDVYGIKVDKSKSIEEILSNPDVAKALKELPLISICVGNNGSLQNILELKKILDSNGINKILIAKDSKNDLLDKIKRGMLIYSDINNEYKYSLGYDLYSEILE